MTTQNIYEGIGHIIHISTNIGRPCDDCNEMLGLGNFAESVNHCLEKHGYKLLHIGSEAGDDAEYKPCHHTVAVVGK
jgi:hypothetical protein